MITCNHVIDSLARVSLISLVHTSVVLVMLLLGLK